MADMLITPSELASALQQDVDTATATLLIELATGKVQAACGQLLVDTTSTITLHVDPCSGYDPWLPLPQRPVRAVGSVLIDGVAVTDWYLRDQQLWRLNGWNVNASAPTEISVVDLVHGYLDGAQALQLARGMVLGLAMAGYGNPGGATSEAIDDYRVTYAEADARMQVTDSMRDQLVAAYGVSAYVTTSR